MWHCKASGYNVICLPADDREAVNVGLRFVNNDACYPAIISIGQLIEALKVENMTCKTLAY